MPWQAVRRLLHRMQSAVTSEGPGLVVLGYHLVEAGTSSPVDVSQAVFRRQMLELLDLAQVVALSEATSCLQGSGGVKRQAVVTFDDAYENFYTTAWPVLRELEVPATLFVPVGFVAGQSPPPMAGTGTLPAATWEQLAEMTSTGLLTAGSHTWSHPDLRALSQERATDELERSKGVLEDRLGVGVDSFCYPRGLWSRAVEDLVSRFYRLATVGGGRRVTVRNLRPLRLWRVPIRRDMPPSVGPILHSPVWLEEWCADKVRRYLAPDRHESSG